MSTTPHTQPGQLCIWTDTDPQAEADFNTWYDREHMQERVGIRGFRFARRFLANDGAARRYLALYVTESLDVFRSDAYHQAFTQQTDWSLRNFARMSDTQRRVGELAFEAGEGEGAHVAIFVASPAALAAAPWRDLADEATHAAGMHAVRVFRTDGTLSAPLSTGGAGNTAARTAQEDAMVFVEGSLNDAARAAAQHLAQACDVAPDSVRSFDMLWRLSA
ncbi:DUF4286 family protein [Paraburkholderia silvatlantica]|uniref:NIPSNAP protein n=1 Tax=Paraburkholderia silvatlantica TaxID=321895 RepID=A0ABR6FSW5_9BURK|nr:DUF4286 family protein [Paraburkholderia silvatlantica]MBB2930529.1 hypothetical protein [Paraburkholderia silvatlantica]PVY30336.1 hypothetical protein C7411_11390 [Paraburkholderia silvatlantica]PXW36927.1 hypothetical protein C7413_113120 [Paraburkholderia silvatlantica]